MLIRTFIAVALGVILACRGSDPQPLELVFGDNFSASNSLLAGGGTSEYVAYSRWDGGGRMSVRFLRHRASAPDALELVGELNLGGGLGVSDLVVADEVAALYGAQGVTVVELPSLTSTTFSLGGAPDALAISGRWMLLATGDALTLVSLDSPSVAAGSFVPSSPVTALLATQGTFLAFTKTGYVHVTPGTNPTFAAVEDPVIRNFSGAFADGAEAIVAGPSSSLGRSRLVRLDLRTPGVPTLVRSDEIDGPFASFAWDGAAMSVIALGQDALSGGSSGGYVIREEGETFASHGIPLPLWYRGPHRIAAHADHLFALSESGFGFFRVR